MLALARRQEEVAGRGSSPEGTEERRELAGGKGGKEVAGRGSSARSRRRRAVAAAMEGARQSGVSESGRPDGDGMCGAGRWEPLLSSNPSGLWASQSHRPTNNLAQLQKPDREYP